MNTSKILKIVALVVMGAGLMYGQASRTWRKLRAGKRSGPFIQLPGYLCGNRDSRAIARNRQFPRNPFHKCRRGHFRQHQRAAAANHSRYSDSSLGHL